MLREHLRDKRRLGTGLGGQVEGVLTQEPPLELLIDLPERRVRTKGIPETQTHLPFLGVGLDQRGHSLTHRHVVGYVRLKMTRPLGMVFISYFGEWA